MVAKVPHCGNCRGKGAYLAGSSWLGRGGLGRRPKSDSASRRRNGQKCRGQTMGWKTNDMECALCVMSNPVDDPRKRRENKKDRISPAALRRLSSSSTTLNQRFLSTATAVTTATTANTVTAATTTSTTISALATVPPLNSPGIYSRLLALCGASIPPHHYPGSTPAIQCHYTDSARRLRAVTQAMPQQLRAST